MVQKKEMTGRITAIIAGLLFLLTVQCLSFAQGRSGKLQGTVKDSTTGETLFGANIIIDGTSLGAASDIDGKYLVPQISPGTYKVIISYIGYIKQEISVDIKEGQTSLLNIALVSQSILGQEVVVTAQAQGQKAAINQQLTANTIINVVSAEKIRQLPDASAATALSRLPGLSLMNGDQVVVRGIQAKQNLIMINGIQLPSTDINNRATNLGFISSNMLSGIEVVKVLTPDMDANAIGGIVNLRLREAPSDFHFDMLSQGSVNHQDRTLDNYRFWASASNRYFDDKLGVFVQGNSDRFNGGNDQTTAGYERYESLPYGEAPYRMTNFTFSDQQNITSTAGGSIILDFELPNGKIMMQNTISNAIYNTATHNTQYSFSDNRVVYSLNRDKNSKILLVNALQTEYYFGDIKAELTLSHSYSDKNTDVRFGDAGDATNFQNTSDPAPYGVDADGNPITYSVSRNTLTAEEAQNIKINPDNFKQAIIQDWAVIRSQAFDQHIYNSSLDFTIPISFSTDFNSKFKVGGKFTRTTRNNDLNQWYKRTGDEDFYAAVRDFIPGKYLTNTDPILFTDLMNNDYTRGDYFLDDTYDYQYAFDIDKTSDFYTLARTGWGQSVHQAGTVQNDFNGAEIFSAGYLMGTFNIGPQIELISGFRYEHYNMKYKATNFYVTHPVDGNGKLMDTINTVDRNDDTFFPNAQLRYKFTDWCDIRLAYSQTVSRPDYQAILPNTFFSEGLSTIAGNPKLNPTISTNFDGYLSFYSNEIGLFTIGGFYKKLSNVFYNTSIFYQNLGYYDAAFPDSSFWQSQGIKPPGPSERISTYLNNPYPAYIKGLELEWQTNFWYLPEPFNSVVLNINYTKVWSEMDYQQLRNEPVRVQVVDPVTGRIKFVTTYVTSDTIRTARLLNQGDDIINIALGVDYKGFSGRISFNMQGNVITSVGSRPEDDQYTGNIFKWDFTLKQELPIDGLSVSLSGINIFHNAIKTYQKFRREIDGVIYENLGRTTYTPRIFELNVRYTL
ncbi:MAG: TonB-dependent receptor [bacterium]